MLARMFAFVETVPGASFPLGVPFRWVASGLLKMPIGLYHVVPPSREAKVLKYCTGLASNTAVMPVVIGFGNSKPIYTTPEVTTIGCAVEIFGSKGSFSPMSVSPEVIKIGGTMGISTTSPMPLTVLGTVTI